MKKEPKADTKVDTKAEPKTKNGLFVGQVLFKEVSDRNGVSITEHTITKIGHKYFECTDLWGKNNH